MCFWEISGAPEPIQIAHLRTETRAREGRRCYAAEGEKAYESWLRREHARSKFAFVKGAKAALGKPKPQETAGAATFLDA